MSMGEKGFKDHFSGHAQGYSGHRPGYPAALFAYLADSAPARARAWDCATGNGQAARGLAPHFQEVIATDASAAQLAHGCAPANVGFRVAAAEASGLDDGSVDLITVAQALHWFDLEGFYREARRVLRPNGLLAAWCYALFDATPAVERAVARLYGEIVGPYWPPERRLIDEGYATLPFPFRELAAPEFKMRRRLTFDELLGYLRTWSAVQRYLRERGQDPLDAITDELRGAWPGSGKRLEVRWTLCLRVGRKT